MKFFVLLIFMFSLLFASKISKPFIQMGHTEKVNSIDFSPDGRYVVSGSTDTTLKLWDAKKGTLLMTLVGHTMRINKVAFSSDGKYIVSGSDDHTVKVWNSKTGKVLWDINESKSPINDVSFSSNGKYILVLNEHNIKVWDWNNKNIFTIITKASEFFIRL